MSASGSVFTVKSHEVPEYRKHFEPALKAIERTRIVTLEDVFQQAHAGQAQLWGYARNGQVEFAAATRVHEMAQGKLCSIWIGAGAGTHDVFREVNAEIERWARSIGCYALEIVGRKGWKRVLPGYEEEAVVLVKPLQRMN